MREPIKMSTINSTKFNESPALVKENLTDDHQSVKGNFLFSNKNHKRKYVFEIYENYVSYTPPTRSPFFKNYVGSHRGEIKTFSPRSRFRLFVLLGKMDHVDNLQAIFVTLTYHYGYRGEERKAQIDFHNYLTRLRLYDPDVQYIWRIELQKRNAPHFHMIILPGKHHAYFGDNKYVASLNILWHTISDPTSRAHEKYGFKVVPITNYTKACAYLSKYIAKYDVNSPSSGSYKHWGNSRNLPISEPSSHTCIRENAYLVIEEIRRWLLKNGKSKYSSEEYFNIHRPQGIFINISDFENILRIVSTQTCVFKDGPDGFD